MKKMYAFDRELNIFHTKDREDSPQIRLSYKYLQGVYHDIRLELRINEVAAYKKAY